jgi:hypothetical protein
MEQTNVIQLGRPAFHDSLTDVVRHGARELSRGRGAGVAREPQGA